MRPSIGMALAALALCATAALAGEAPEAPPHSFQAITLRLAETRITLDAQDMPPDQAFELIRKAGDVNIVIAPQVRQAWEGKTVSLRLENVTALSAFHHLLRHLDLCAHYADEAMVVTTPEAVEPAPQVYVYDIRDLVEAPRSFRPLPTLFGSQIDPLYYYMRLAEPTAAFGGPRSLREFMDDLESLDREPPDPYGEIIAQVIEEKTNAKERGVSVTYRDGYLIVVEQPRPARLSPGEGNIQDALLPPKD